LTKKPAQAPIRIISTTATGRCDTKIMVMTMRPIATPIGSTLTDWRSEMKRAAMTAPSAMPMATTPVR